MIGLLLAGIVLEPPAVAAEARLGSYGRAVVSTDLEGGQGDAVNVVSFGTRLEKGPYAELDVVLTEETEDGAAFTAVITTAMAGDVFHYDGEWDADLAIRNLFVGAEGWSSLPLTAWAGSRMYRGDDVHLLDFWPMDDLNTVGGGLNYHPDGWSLAVHAGLNRLTGDDWQSQLYPVPEAGGVGEEALEIVDRQRAVASLKMDKLSGPIEDAFRIRLYGELHTLPEGTRVVDDTDVETLPADGGLMAGVQLSKWGWAPSSFVHAWYRVATGLAAYDELAIPDSGYAPDETVRGAVQHRFALAANHQSGSFGVLAGAYLQRFDDADDVTADIDDRWEGNLALRPQLFVGEHINLGVELSHQWLIPDGLNPRTDTYELPRITKLAILPAIQPRPGSFARPQIRVQYVATMLNDDARLWFDYRDERAAYNLQHFVGIGAEWWINSANYSM
jgi:hypothetical protein